MGIYTVRSSCSEMLLRKVVLKICSKFTGEHPCRSAILISPQQRKSNLLGMFERSNPEHREITRLIYVKMRIQFRTVDL